MAGIWIDRYAAAAGCSRHCQLDRGRNGQNSTFTHAFRALLLAEVAVWLMGKRLNGDAAFDEAPHHSMGFRLQYAAVMYVELIAVYAVLG